MIRDTFHCDIVLMAGNIACGKALAAKLYYRICVDILTAQVHLLSDIYHLVGSTSG